MNKLYLKNIIFFGCLFIVSMTYSQEKFDEVTFLKKTIEQYTNATSMEIEVKVSLYEKNSNSGQNSFTCITKKQDNKSFLDIRNTYLITTDSLRLFIDHKTNYMQLQKITNNNLKSNEVTDYIENISNDISDFISKCQIENLKDTVIFKQIQPNGELVTNYYFDKNTFILSKVVNFYNSEEIPYEKVEMIYKTNLNEKEGKISIDLEEFISIKNGFVYANQSYKDYEFINPFKDE